MTGGSLRLRLLAAAAVSIAIALLAAGFALARIFEQEVRARLDAELGNHLLQLAGALERESSGTLVVTRDLADPRFQRPLSGLYWQVSAAAPAQRLTSRSLLGERLADDNNGEEPILGPNDEPLLRRSREVTIAALRAVLTVAIDARELRQSVAKFNRAMAWSLGLMGAALIAAAWVQVAVGLSPLAAIRSGLTAIRTGSARRLVGTFPNEIEPLAADFNLVLEAQEKSLGRARSRAGDLAHGLKTPLTVLSALARDVGKAGLVAEAAEIEAQAEAMHRHIERQLVRARLASGRAVTLTPLREPVERVLAAMARAPRGDRIDWTIDIASDAAVPVEREDLIELLGNLLDNARKWTRSRVRVAFARDVLTIEDDGAGVPDVDRLRILERGLRLDESAQGSGLGLAIVNDIAEVYGLALDLAKSNLGGLAVSISLAPRP